MGGTCLYGVSSWGRRRGAGSDPIAVTEAWKKDECTLTQFLARQLVLCNGVEIIELKCARLRRHFQGTLQGVGLIFR